MKITLCGSTKFLDDFALWNKQLALWGHTVYSLAIPSRDFHDPNSSSEKVQQQKTILDLVHLSKIEESDAVAILNREGYIGESTTRELLWARIRSKRVYWLETEWKHRLVGERGLLELTSVTGD